MRVIQFFVVVSSLFWSVAFAQKATLGPILDNETLSPIKGASIEIDGKPVGRTDGNGQIVLGTKYAGDVTVKVSADGFETAEEILPSDQLGGHVILLFKPGMGGEVIEVAGEKAIAPPKPLGKQEITRQELSRIPGTRGDALQSVKSLPGVGSVDAAGSGPGLLVIRGSAPEDSAIQIDGIDVPIAYHFFGLQSILPNEFIDSIEYLPGGFGVEYGRATGGVIHLHTRSEQPERWTGSAETALVSASGLIEGPISKKHNVSMMAGFRRSMIDLFLPLVIPEDSGVNFVTAPQYYDGQLRVDWRPNFRHRLSSFALVSYDLLTLINDQVDPNEPLLTGKWENRTSFTRLINTWAYEGDSLKSKLVMALGTTTFGFDVGSDRYLNFDTRRIELREDLALKLHDKVLLRLGGEGRINENLVKVKFPLPPSEGQGGMLNFSTAPTVELDENTMVNSFATYAALDIRPLENTTVSAGLRLDYFAYFDALAWGPRVMVEHKLIPDLSLRAAMGSYSRQGEQNEALTKSLDAEYATQYVAGTEWTPQEGLSLASSFFYTDRRNLIEQDANLAAEDPLNSYINRGYGRSFGGEILIKLKKNNLFGWLAYTLSKSDRVDGAILPKRLFDYDQTHVFSMLASYKWRTWEFGGRWQYATGQPTTDVVGSIFASDFNVYLPVLGEVNSSRFEAAHQLDIRIDKRWQFEKWKFSAFLDITNVYAHPKTLGYQYNFDYSEREAIKELPFVPSIGVRGDF